MLLKGKTIAVVAADRGGWNAWCPVLNRLANDNADVHVHLTGTCARQYEEKTLSLVDGATYHRFIGHTLRAADVLLLAASQSKDGVEDNAAAYARYANQKYSKNSRIVALEDMYGSLHPTLDRLNGIANLANIDRFLVIDALAKRLLLKALSGYQLDSRVVVATGNPHFDRFFEMKTSWQERRRAIRESLSLSENTTLVLIIGGLNGTDEILLLFKDAMEKLRGKYTLILRTHPRSTPEDGVKTVSVREQLPAELFCAVSKEVAPTTDDLLPAADIVISPYSTINYIGILCRMPGVVYADTPSIRRDLYEEKGVDVPFEAQAGAGWYVGSADELAEAIQAVRDKGGTSEKLQAIRKVQTEIAAQFDGQATERVLEQITEVLGS